MKKIFLPLSLTAILLAGFSCREHNSQAKTPSDTNQMEEVRESKEDAMEKEKERTGTNRSQMDEDSMSKKDSPTDNLLGENKN